MMMSRSIGAAVAGGTAALVLAAGPAQAVQVQVSTPLGNYTLQTREDAAPTTVARFLSYIENGIYDNTIIHRSVPDFVIQGGGFTFLTDSFAAVPSVPTIPSEFSLPNLRGTVAIAQSAGPDSGTNQWFINVVDNPGLDTQQFTVFAEVIAGMDVVDAINDLTRYNFGGKPFDEVPLSDAFQNNRSVLPSDFITTSYTVLSTPEPGSAVLLALGGLAMMRRRR